MQGYREISCLFVWLYIYLVVYLQYKIKGQSVGRCKVLVHCSKGVKKCLWWLQPPKARKTTESAAYLHTRAKVVFYFHSLNFLQTKYYKS